MSVIAKLLSSLINGRKFLPSRVKRLPAIRICFTSKITAQLGISKVCDLIFNAYLHLTSKPIHSCFDYSVPRFATDTGGLFLLGYIPMVFNV
jgi:hypothetical protein